MPHQSHFDQGLGLSFCAAQGTSLTDFTVAVQGEGFLKPAQEVLMGALGAEEHTASSWLILAEQDFSIT